ncbi:MAG: YjjG family noncanonical pyrimidine nucleotidase [Ruminococcus sp.]|nr:YjjG family noncanonical pyrimidine nucleotidase [Ruminococcus sp.]
MSNFDLSKKRFDIVLLDADETVFDFKKAEAYSFKLMLESYGIDYTDERLALYSSVNLSMWKALERGEVTREKLKTLRFEKFFSEIGVSGIDCVEVNDRYLTNLSNSTFMIDGAAEFVKELHKYCKIYLATNGLTKAQTGRLSKSEIKDFVDGMFISEEIGYAKPDKAYFDFIFDSIKVTDKSRVIMLGDSLTSDMLGGRNAGITTCRFNRDGVIVESDLCDYQITRYDEFFDILFSE